MRKLVLLLVSVTMAVGCGGGNGTDPSRAVSSLRLSVSTAEAETGRSLMVVGQSGSARVTTNAIEGCFDPPCEVSVTIELRSSNPAVMAPERQRVQTPAQVALVAKTLGTAQLAASVQGLSQSRRIDVVSAPLPVDSIRIRSGWSAFDSTISVVHDPSGQLVELTLPVLGYAALETRIFRGDQRVTIMTPPWTIESSDPRVAWVDRNCRAAVVDPRCEVATSEGWITGLAPGTASVTVTARNIQRTFAVTVQ